MGVGVEGFAGKAIPFYNYISLGAKILEAFGIDVPIFSDISSFFGKVTGNIFGGGGGHPDVKIPPQGMPPNAPEFTKEFYIDQPEFWGRESQALHSLYSSSDSLDYHVNLARRAIFNPQFNGYEGVEEVRRGFRETAKNIEEGNLDNLFIDKDGNPVKIPNDALNKKFIENQTKLQLIANSFENIKDVLTDNPDIPDPDAWLKTNVIEPSLKYNYDKATELLNSHADTLRSQYGRAFGPGAKPGRTTSYQRSTVEEYKDDPIISENSYMWAGDKRLFPFIKKYINITGRDGNIIPALKYHALMRPRQSSGKDLFKPPTTLAFKEVMGRSPETLRMRESLDLLGRNDLIDKMDAFLNKHPENKDIFLERSVNQIHRMFDEAEAEGLDPNLRNEFMRRQGYGEFPEDTPPFVDDNSWLNFIASFRPPEPAGDGGTGGGDGGGGGDGSGDGTGDQPPGDGTGGLPPGDDLPFDEEPEPDDDDDIDLDIPIPPIPDGGGGGGGGDGGNNNDTPDIDLDIPSFPLGAGGITGGQSLSPVSTGIRRVGVPQGTGYVPEFNLFRRQGIQFPRTPGILGQSIENSPRTGMLGKMI